MVNIIGKEIKGVAWMFKDSRTGHISGIHFNQGNVTDPSRIRPAVIGAPIWIEDKDNPASILHPSIQAQMPRPLLNLSSKKT